MKSLTSREAADLLEVRVQRWHRLAAEHNLTPERELPGIRGAKFWRRRDVERVRKALNQTERVAS
jgi:hypothetical protein